MMINKQHVPFAVKEIGDSGEFSGYASVFDVVDSYNDVVVRGAFERTISEFASAGQMPKLLYQHDATQIIGEHITLREDEKGLYIEGKLYKDDVESPEAGKAYKLLKRNQLTGISIGFTLYENGEEYDTQRGVWLLKAIKLWENSLVTFPANPDAQVDTVKSIVRRGDQPPPKTMERALRSLGLSNSQSRRFMAEGYKSLQPEFETQQAIDVLLDKLRAV